MLRAVRRLPWLLLVVWLGCGESAGPPPREVEVDVTVDDSGLSEEVSFEIPAGTRSITLIVEGAPDALYALGVFSLGDGADLVQLPAGPPGPAMQMTYQQEQIGQMPGLLFQSIRLGTYTHVYPYRPDQVVYRASADRIQPSGQRHGADPDAR